MRVSGDRVAGSPKVDNDEQESKIGLMIAILKHRMGLASQNLVYLLFLSDFFFDKLLKGICSAE